MYKVFNENGEVIDIGFDDQSLTDFYWNEIQNGKYEIRYIVSCKNCDNEGEEQFDAYGISTGYWCNSCYNSSDYPYRKDRYPTIETHGYGENLD